MLEINAGLSAPMIRSTESLFYYLLTYLLDVRPTLCNFDHAGQASAYARGGRMHSLSREVTRQNGDAASCQITVRTCYMPMQLLNDRDVANDFAMKALEYANGFEMIG